MIERSRSLIILALLAAAFVSVPSVMFHNTLRKYFNFMGHWSVATIKPSRNAQIPSMHARPAPNRPGADRPELRFVKFTVKLPKAGSVKIAGDFNKWNPDALALVKRDKNTWGTIIPLQPGIYHYLYNIDGLFILDPLNPDTAMLGDKKVSVLTVK